MIEIRELKHFNNYLYFISDCFGLMFGLELRILASSFIIIKGVEFGWKIGIELDWVSDTLQFCSFWGVFRNALQNGNT
jgi:hypothetical protein